MENRGVIGSVLGGELSVDVAEETRRRAKQRGGREKRRRRPVVAESEEEREREEDGEEEREEDGEEDGEEHGEEDEEEGGGEVEQEEDEEEASLSSVVSDTYDESAVTPTEAPPLTDPYSDTLRPFPHTSFIETYLSLNPGEKFNLSPTRTLEDTIYHHVRTCTSRSWLHDNPILDWTVDLSDSVVASWFEDEERSAILGSGPGLPPRDEAFEYAVSRFPLKPKSIEELYDITETPSRPQGEPFDACRHATALYANSAASSV
ncbi:hypothetical protein DFP73DRAFT_347264 [Morchella snyderi]|nr:hypothetical protein DFP73DRAFT_347264 [Morchella snyderi]